jgi:hypothetical protein
MRELETDDQVRCAAEPLRMRSDERAREVFETLQRAIRDHELAGVGAGVFTDGDRLAAPDELRAALPEATPAAEREVARAAIFGPVPAFHGLHHPPIADSKTAHNERLRERGSIGFQDLAVAGHARAQPREVGAELIEAHGPDPRVAPSFSGAWKRLAHTASVATASPPHKQASAARCASGVEFPWGGPRVCRYNARPSFYR